jgi:hypothetical protein
MNFDNLQYPELSPVPGDKVLWHLEKDFTVDVLTYRITVKTGFKTDGESIPAPFWIFTGNPFQPEGMAAAVVHDILYGSEMVAREIADLIFKTLLERYGTGSFSAMVRYRALRMFGWITWKTHTVQSIASARRFVSMTTLA